jgi:adenylate kinase/phosphoserine phosphatase
MSTSASSKSTIVGLYGISGCGKSHLLNQLKTQLPSNDFAFYDGSTLIDGVVPGGLLEFKNAFLQQQAAYRQQAISKAASDCRNAGKIGVITGHALFWQKDGLPDRIWTERDRETYTHMVYLNVDPDLIASRRKNDKNRTREELPVEHLRKWQGTELKELRITYCDHGILFTAITEKVSTTTGYSSLERLATLLKDFRSHDEAKNASAVMHAVDTGLANHIQLETVLMLDADKTLAPQDTGLLFWQEATSADQSPEYPLSQLPKGRGYSYASLRQAMLLYEERADDFNAICDKIATRVDMYREMIELLKRIATSPHVDALVVTCGLRHVWEQVLARYGLSHVKVVGGGRLSDGYVVTGSIKGDIVDTLHEKKLRIVAFGDSQLDIEMFHKADEAYVVVGEKATRSTSMDKVLNKAIHEQGLSALQVVLPQAAEHRLDLDTLPKAALDSTELDFVFRRRSANRFVHATHKRSAKLLMTPTRDASNRSHVLRQTHQRVGNYLAMEYVSDIIGLEEVEIQHVQGREGDTDHPNDEGRRALGLRSERSHARSWLCSREGVPRRRRQEL